ncbi:MAG TPA: cytochrome P450 [Acidimicrobiales bacterium]|nr:cytochrome P450 [Acidimicrobiales bacterium]
MLTELRLDDPALIADPYPYYAWLRDDAPVHRCAQPDVWLVSRHDDVVAVLRDPRRFASDVLRVTGSIQGSPFNPALRVPPVVARAVARNTWLRVLLTSDPPEHTVLRRKVSRAFTPRMMTTWEQRIRVIADEQVAALVRAAAGGPVDLVTGVASPLPTRVIAEMMAIPPRRQADFKRWSDWLVGGLLTGGSVPRLLAAAAEISLFFARTVRVRRRRPGDDLVSLLVAGDEDEALSSAELVAFCVLLLVAGNETTTNLISNAVLALDARPEVRRRLVADPSLAARVVEETLRYDGPGQGLIRATTGDVEIAGVNIPARSLVMPLIGSANRDPRRWSEPDRFDIDRQGMDHLAFGTGLHYCLGQALARLEARIVLETLFRAAPGLRVAGEPDRIPSPVLRGLRRLPVRVSG